jgi:hypothetical protein
MSNLLHVVTLEAPRLIQTPDLQPPLLRQRVPQSHANPCDRTDPSPEPLPLVTGEGQEKVPFRLPTHAPHVLHPTVIARRGVRVE